MKSFGEPLSDRPSYRFPSDLRIKRSVEFANIFRKGRVANDNVLVVHAVRGAAEATRLGLSLSKKVGCAPLRNRWKRLIREAFRKNREQLPAGLLIVVRPRKGAEPAYQSVEASLLRLVHRVDRQLR